MYTNAQGLRSKFPELYSRHLHYRWNLIAITETWLTPSVLDSEITLPGLSVVRSDRTSHGGGVALYYPSDLLCDPLLHLATQIQDSLFLNLQLNSNDNCLVAVIYRPPNSPTTHDEQLAEALDSMLHLKYTHALILGDFNFPSLGQR